MKQNKPTPPEKKRLNQRIAELEVENLRLTIDNKHRVWMIGEYIKDIATIEKEVGKIQLDNIIEGHRINDELDECLRCTELRNSKKSDCCSIHRTELDIITGYDQALKEVLSIFEKHREGKT